MLVTPKIVYNYPTTTITEIVLKLAAQGISYHYSITTITEKSLALATIF